MNKIFILALAIIFFPTICAAQTKNFSALEEKYNSVIGIYAIDTENNKTVEYNANLRFAYCSTHKVFTVAELLRQKSLNELKKVKHYKDEDILSYAPITKNHVADGMIWEEICQAALRVSDNTAANLILEEIGGVKAFRKFLRRIGDNATFPVRVEPELNFFSPNDIRDTSTPRQMALNLKKYILGNELSDKKKKLLIDWMSNNSITDTLIKAGVPKNYSVTDKSGSGANYATRNDIAVIYPPNHKPIVIAIMTRSKNVDAQFDDALIADITKIIFNLEE